MRFAVLAAAVAAIWVQPAAAATVLSQHYFLVNNYTHVFSHLHTCETTYPCEYAIDFTFNSPFSQGHLRYLYGSPPTALILNGVDYSATHVKNGFDANAYLKPIALTPTGNVLRMEGTVFGYGSGSVVTIDATPTPEPATWAMLLLGFGLIGGAMRSTKRRKIAAS